MIKFEWEDITKNIGADIVVIDMPLLDARQKKVLLGAFINDLILSLLSYVAQKERESIKTRQRQGIDIALANGVKFGRTFLFFSIRREQNVCKSLYYLIQKILRYDFRY